MRISQPTTRTSTAILIVTVGFFVLMIGIAATTLVNRAMIVPAALLVVTCVFAYAWSPVSYRISDEELPGVFKERTVPNHLTVYFRLGKKHFPYVIRCSLIDYPFSRVGIRVFGNGGLFAGVGIFWNRTLGLFRAYVTSARKRDWVLVETADDRKILISPADPVGFVQSWERSGLIPS